MQVTVQGRLKGEFNDSLLHDFATLYAHATHDLFALHQSGQNPAKRRDPSAFARFCNRKLN